MRMNAFVRATRPRRSLCEVIRYGVPRHLPRPSAPSRARYPSATRARRTREWCRGRSDGRRGRPWSRPWTADAGMIGPAFHAGFEERAVDDQLTAAVEESRQAHFCPWVPRTCNFFFTAATGIRRPCSPARRVHGRGSTPSPFTSSVLARAAFPLLLLTRILERFISLASVSRSSLLVSSWFLPGLVGFVSSVKFIQTNAASPRRKSRFAAVSAMFATHTGHMLSFSFPRLLFFLNKAARRSSEPSQNLRYSSTHSAAPCTARLPISIEDTTIAGVEGSPLSRALADVSETAGSDIAMRTGQIGHAAIAAGERARILRRSGRPRGNVRFKLSVVIFNHWLNI